MTLTKPASFRPVSRMARRIGFLSMTKNLQVQLIRRFGIRQAGVLGCAAPTMFRQGGCAQEVADARGGLALVVVGALVRFAVRAATSSR